jgi:membrane protease YdiL (CAAX protease family)
VGDPTQITEQIEDQAASPLEHLRGAMLSAAIAPDEAAEMLTRVTESIDTNLAALDDRATEIDPTTEPLEAELESIDEEIAYLFALRAEAEQIADLLENGHDALTHDQRTALTTRHKRYAEIALLHDNPDRETLAAPLHANGIRLIAAIGGAFALLALAGLSGIVLFIIAIVRTSSGNMKWRFADSVGIAPHHTNAFLEVFPVFMLCFLAVGVLGGILAASVNLGIPDPVFQALIIWPLLLCALWPVARGVPIADLRAALGWHANGAGPLGVLKELAMGVVGYCAGLPIVAVGLGTTLLFLAIQALIFTDAAPPSHPGVESMLDGTLISSLALYSLACLWAPIVEETIFRGSLFAHLRRGWHPVLAALTVAFFFAIIHPQGLAATPALMSLGIVFCLIREWRGSLIAPILAHALNNFVLISILLLATA